VADFSLFDDVSRHQAAARASRRTGPGAGHAKRNQARPMMEAVAISSSSRANDTLPDTA
jgi:hypothetical protein